MRISDWSSDVCSSDLPSKVMKKMTVSTATLGFPRIGTRRELKFALESFWAGKSSLADLQTAAAGLRVVHWARQKALGAAIRSEARRVGNEGVSQCRSRWSPYS